MAFKTHISNATQNQPGQVTNELTAVGNRGVHDVARTDFQVTGTAGRAVNVAKGEALVEATSYVYGSMDQKFFGVSSDATISNLAIAANSSGNPRIDLVCIKVDTAITPGVQGVTASSVVVVQGTAGASPVPPTIPSNHLVLAEVDVANGASVISNAEIRDRRIQFAPRIKGGWEFITDTATYNAADAPTFTIRFASVDVTDRIWVGMKIRLRQSSASYKYFIVTAVAFSTNTDVTVYGGTDYTLTNATITDFYVSALKAPTGFPMSPAKWTQQLTNSSDQLQSTPVSGTVYNPGTVTMSIPIGVWDTRFSGVAYGDSTSITNNWLAAIDVGMSTANNSFSDTELKGRARAQYYINSGSAQVSATISVSKTLVLAAKTTYFVNASISGSNLSSVGYNNGVIPLNIRCICAYL